MLLNSLRQTSDKEEQETGDGNDMDSNNNSNITIDIENNTEDNAELTTMMEYGIPLHF